MWLHFSMSYYFFRLCLRNYLQQLQPLPHLPPLLSQALTWTGKPTCPTPVLTTTRQCDSTSAGKVRTVPLISSRWPAYSAVDAADNSGLEFSAKPCAVAVSESRHLRRIVPDHRRKWLWCQRGSQVFLLITHRNQWAWVNSPGFFVCA